MSVPVLTCVIFWKHMSSKNVLFNTLFGNSWKIQGGQLFILNSPFTVSVKEC